MARPRRTRGADRHRRHQGRPARQADGCFVNTAGIGVLERPVRLSAAAARPATRSSSPDRSEITDHDHAGARRAGHRVRPALRHGTAHRAHRSAAGRRAADALRPRRHRGGSRPSATSCAGLRVAVVLDEQSIRCDRRSAAPRRSRHRPPLRRLRGRFVAVVAETRRGGVAALRTHPRVQRPR